MSCQCVGCPDCNGSGHQWVTLDGVYHRTRCDDMCEIETCPTCHGSGSTEECDECAEKREDEVWA